MRKISNSQPLSIAVQYDPLHTAFSIRPKMGMSTMQYYKQTVGRWIPDHTHDYAYGDYNAVVDGPLVLEPVFQVADPDGLVSEDSVTHNFYWYADGVAVTSSSPSSDYYIQDDRLVVRRNFTHLEGARIRCDCKFVDPRTGGTSVLSDSIQLSAVLQADEQWSVYILNDRTHHHHPLSAASSLYTFEAQASLGGVDKSDVVQWFWDFSEDLGATWNEFSEDTLLYVSGKNTRLLTIDADFSESVVVRCRIASEVGAPVPDVPNSATASLAWRFPLLTPQVFSYGGDKLMANDKEMRFGLIVHYANHADLSLDQQREWLICNWKLRIQGVSDSAVSLSQADVEVSVPASAIRNPSGFRYVADPNCAFRGAFCRLQSSSGEDLASSSGQLLTARG